MRASLPSRGTLAGSAALLIGCLCVYSSWRPASATGANVDRSSPVLREFDKLVPLLPASGPVGYVGPADNRRYFLGQHALVPRVLVRGAGPPWVIVDGRPPGGLAPLLATHVATARRGELQLFRRKR
jgi:hypothetical protein